MSRIDHLYLDIETRPCADREGFIAARGPWPEDTPPPGNYKKAEAIEKWRVGQRAAWDADADKEYRNTSLSAADGGEILCICAAYYDQYGARHEFRGRVLRDGEEVLSPGEALYIDERNLLQAWDAWADGRNVSPSTTWLGHNIRRFDVPYLWQRAWINRLNPGPPPGRSSMFDIMEEWHCGGLFGRETFIKLDKIARALGIPGKPEDIDGSRVWDVWQEEGGPERVLEYCAEDVRIVEQIHERMAPWIA